MTFLFTSCVEAGVTFSFRTAFCESWGFGNLLPMAGRTGIADWRSQISNVSAWRGFLPLLPAGQEGFEPLWLRLKITDCRFQIPNRKS
jgi:hypothetical protein